MSRDCAWCHCATHDYAIRKNNLICKPCAEMFDYYETLSPEEWAREEAAIDRYAAVWRQEEGGND